jgi:hypothetical protein
LARIGSAEPERDLRRVVEQYKMNMFNLEFAQAEDEVRQLEVRLRLAPRNDAQLLYGLQRALEQKRERLAILRARRGQM